MRDRRERFVSLAEARTDRALKSIRSIANLSNRSNYEYTEEDVEQITRALDREVRALRAKFQESQAGRKSSFKLKTAAKKVAK